MRDLLLIGLLIFFQSCNHNSSSSSASSPLFNAGPVSLLEGGKDYSLEGQSDKVITLNLEDHVPMNIISQELTMTFDASAQTFEGHSKIKFKLKHPGRGYFELQGTPKNITLDGTNTTANSISDPDGQGQNYWSIEGIVSSDATHEVEFDYTLPSGRMAFTGGGVRFLTDMTDLVGKFFEYWGPVGFEEDQFTMSLTMKILNGSSSHKLRTNGTITLDGPTEWKIIFPDYFSKSSFYVHLTNQNLPSKTLTYKGLNKDTPIEVYGLTQALVDGAVADLPGLFKELEADYGPFPHEKFLAYMNDRSGGMEYVAATITARGSLDHELLHSWFGRSVIPADGRSGWIDEAMASWRDYGYKRSSSLLSRSFTNLANYSPFKKNTPSNCYVDGRGLFAELDYVFKELGGLKKVMKALHEEYNNRVINNEEFWSFLESYTQINLDEFQVQYVMGKQQENVSAESVTITGSSSKHPRPLTEAEVRRLR